MLSYELQLAYEEYCIDCYAEGLIPKKIWQWLEGEE